MLNTSLFTNTPWCRAIMIYILHELNETQKVGDNVQSHAVVGR